MKLDLIKYLKSLNWSKEDVKKILMFIIMLLIACFILNNFLLIKVRIKQEKQRPRLISNSDEKVIYIAPQRRDNDNGKGKTQIKLSTIATDIKKD